MSEKRAALLQQIAAAVVARDEALPALDALWQAAKERVTATAEAYNQACLDERKAYRTWQGPHREHDETVERVHAELKASANPDIPQCIEDIQAQVEEVRRNWRYHSGAERAGQEMDRLWTIRDHLAGILISADELTREQLNEIRKGAGLYRLEDAA